MKFLGDEQLRKKKKPLFLSSVRSPFPARVQPRWISLLPKTPMNFRGDEKRGSSVIRGAAKAEVRLLF